MYLFGARYGVPKRGKQQKLLPGLEKWISLKDRILDDHLRILNGNPMASRIRIRISFHQSSFSFVHIISCRVINRLINMGSDRNLAWLQVVGVNEIRLLDPGHMSRLVRDLVDPINQRPSCILFIGRSTNQALRELFPNNNLKKGFYNGVVNLRVDNSSTYSDHPIFFAESNLCQPISLGDEDPQTYGNESFPIQWAQDMTLQRLYNVLHARLLCLFNDVICIFADDFAHLMRLYDCLCRGPLSVAQLSIATK